MKNQDIFVIIPSYNEAKHIRRCINNVQSVWPRIIAVDDGSHDSTRSILDTFTNIDVLSLPENFGKGAAMNAGANLAWKKGAKAVIFMDGDNQHNPRHITEFVRALKRGHDVVIGVRLLKADIPFYRKMGNLLMVWLMRQMFSIELPDMMCGYRAMTKKGYNNLTFSSKRYGVEVEMLTLLGRKNLPFQTIIVDTIYHDKYKGFSVADGLKILFSLPYYRWRNI